ncbi:S41 family peptidase [Flaviaesturariibacter aridisoli]|nr:S41 family peptidase [Flaviaesturariibacter aridisoli]
MRRLVLLLTLLGSLRATAQQTDSVRLLIDSTLRVMEQHAYNSSRINWAALRDSVARKAAGARSDADAAPALFWAFDQLQDKHGWITIADSTHYNTAVHREQRTLSAGIKAALQKGPYIYNGRVAGRYAYISIHFFMGQTEAAMNAYAQRLQDSLCKNVDARTKGIIIDLRLNGGGNSFPMYQGIVNVLGNRDFGASVDGRGRVQDDNRIRNNRVVLHGNHNDSIVLRLERMCRDLSALPVAVLISPASGSSAEQLAIAFTSRPRTVLIGERTAGYVTGNNGFELPGAGNGIVVAESLTRNTKGKLFTEDVRPGIEVTGGDDFTDRTKDAKIRAAVKWLEGQRSGGR